MGKTERTLYEYTASQDVVALQAKYTLYKQIMNIIMYAKCDMNMDVDLLTKAWKLVVERNDCLRMGFVGSGKKARQYFIDKVEVKDIPYMEFNTDEEFETFIKKYRKIVLKYKKEEVYDIIFCKMPDGKFTVLLKVCHLVLDTYGIGIIFQDLFGVYNALKNGTELPACPGKFEDLVKKDIQYNHNPETEKKNLEFFTEYLKMKEPPYYAGIHGDKHPLWKKQVKKGSKCMKMFFVKCDTEGFKFDIDKETTEKAMKYCAENHYTPANFFFYLCSVVCSKANGNVKNMIPLELCNCRGTVQEKKTAGTKVQSIGCYTTVDGERSFSDNFADFCVSQNQLYRHLGFSDIEYEKLFNKIYKASFLETYYHIIFSFIPTRAIEGVEISFISNGKFVLPAYVALMYDVDNGTMQMVYDAQTILHTENDLKCFTDNFVSVINQVTANPNVLIKDVVVEPY